MSKTLSTQAITPRAAEFCRAAMTVIAAVLGIGALVLFVGVVVSLRTASPSFGQNLPATFMSEPHGGHVDACVVRVVDEFEALPMYPLHPARRWRLVE